MSQPNATTQHAHPEQSPPPETPRELVLGDPLDQMLHSRCRYPFQFFGSPAESPRHGGLVLPTPSDPGTGNIVIRGRPGTGKSTLALQIAAEAVRRNDGIYAAYFSLEENQAQVYRKAVNCGWSPYVWPVNQVFEAEYRPSVDRLAEDLARILDDPMACHTGGDTVDIEDRGKDCPATHTPRLPCPFLDRCRTAADDIERAASAEFTAFPGKVILPQLEPRAFSPDATNVADDSLFWTRYRQIDSLLHAAKELRKPGGMVRTAARRQRDSQGEACDEELALFADTYAVLAGLGARIVAPFPECRACAFRTERTCVRYLSDYGRLRQAMAELLTSVCHARHLAVEVVRRACSGLHREVGALAGLIPCLAPTVRNACADFLEPLRSLESRYAVLVRRYRDAGLLDADPVTSGNAEPSGMEDSLQESPSHHRRRLFLRRLRSIARCAPGKLTRRSLRLIAARSDALALRMLHRCSRFVPPVRTLSARDLAFPFCKLRLPASGQRCAADSVTHWPSGPFDKSLAAVCIDSLNVLGTGGLTRDHLAALFDLFKRRQVIGVFVVEENERGLFAGDSPIDSDTIDFLADVVIELTETEEHGYYVRHFQVAKSRYQKHVLGKHPYKIEGTKKGGDER